MCIGYHFSIVIIRFVATGKKRVKVNRQRHVRTQNPTPANTPQLILAVANWQEFGCGEESADEEQ